MSPLSIHAGGFARRDRFCGCDGLVGASGLEHSVATIGSRRSRPEGPIALDRDGSCGQVVPLRPSNGNAVNEAA